MNTLPTENNDNNTVTINGKVYRVLDGTTTDWRPDDEMGVVYGLMLLSLKKEKRQEMIDSGFAVRVPLQLLLLTSCQTTSAN